MDQQRENRSGLRAALPPATDQRQLTFIEGQLTYDILEDLFLYLCRRQETLVWQLTTLAGEFSVVFDQGQPADCMFRPSRPIGAYVGLKALRTLFQQQGGQFSVSRSAAPIRRRSLSGSGENLLMALAAQGDERSAPAVLSGTTFDSSAELASVQDLQPDAHRTAFLTSSAEMPLADVLQLFSVSRRSYRVKLSDLSVHPSAPRWLGEIELSAHQIISADMGSERGQSAFNKLLNFAGALQIEVSPSSVSLPTGHDLPPNEPPPDKSPLGKLDKLLLSAVMAGELGSASETGAEKPSAAETPSALQRLGTFLRRK
ncbi:DUF4388 domain-containing protein [Deinococcus psychrotolerans]|uniref:DUF4388 domain-containing protein n=1 Tax=Deinococcus psychrotolerans TaxID=2489213 RepID=A0A3G8Y939_9DEIO|nr:DUF4388 domain-containing protein [Deinococcus psychrotolerans]AZI41882.1 DUF4388 domain-containing protein [Deinococcus psychrotolerans]